MSIVNSYQDGNRWVIVVEGELTSDSVEVHLEDVGGWEGTFYVFPHGKPKLFLPGEFRGVVQENGNLRLERETTEQFEYPGVSTPTGMACAPQDPESSSASSSSESGEELVVVRKRGREIPESVGTPSTRAVLGSGVDNGTLCINMGRNSGNNGNKVQYDGDIYKSMCEMKFKMFCHLAGIPCEYERFRVKGGGNAQYYTPDFRLAAQDLIVELKYGEPTDDEVARCEAVAKCGHAIAIVWGNVCYPSAKRWHEQGRFKNTDNTFRSGLTGMMWDRTGRRRTGKVCFMYEEDPEYTWYNPYPKPNSVFLGIRKHTSDERCYHPKLDQIRSEIPDRLADIRQSSRAKRRR